MPTVTCPWCQAKLAAPETAVGRKVKCQKCGQRMRLLESGAVRLAAPSPVQLQNAPGVLVTPWHTQPEGVRAPAAVTRNPADADDSVRKKDIETGTDTSALRIVGYLLLAVFGLGCVVVGWVANMFIFLAFFPRFVDSPPSPVIIIASLIVLVGLAAAVTRLKYEESTLFYLYIILPPIYPAVVNLFRGGGPALIWVFIELLVGLLVVGGWLVPTCVSSSNVYNRLR